MQNYLDLMSRILNEGIICKDRTGVGRQKIFGAELRFKMADGFPMLTTNGVPFKNPVHELLWMISGSSDNKVLNANNVNIWNLWAVKEENIRAFLKKYTKDMGEEFTTAAISALMKERNGDIGPIYGPAWRFAPATAVSTIYPEVTEDQVASDMLALYKKNFQESRKALAEQMKLDPKGMSPEEVEDKLWKTYLHNQFYSQHDQLQSVLYNLKHNPYSSRMVISTWIPSNLPFEHLPPEENVLLGKGALAPCHVLQQYIVFPPEKEGGKLRLSLKLSQRSH